MVIPIGDPCRDFLQPIPIWEFLQGVLIGNPYRVSLQRITIGNPCTEFPLGISIGYPYEEFLQGIPAVNPYRDPYKGSLQGILMEYRCIGMVLPVLLLPQNVVRDDPQSQFRCESCARCHRCGSCPLRCICCAQTPQGKGKEILG